MYEFIKIFSDTARTAVIICINNRRILNWCEYDTSDFVGIYHDDSPIFPKAVNGKVVQFIEPDEALQLLHKIADSTAKTPASRYSAEIMQFIRYVSPYLCKDPVELIDLWASQGKKEE